MTTLIDKFSVPDGVDVHVVRDNGNPHTFHFNQDYPEMDDAQLNEMISLLDDELTASEGGN